MKISHFIKHTMGTAAIEFALLVPVIMLILFGIVNFGLIIAKKNELTGVVSVGMLYAFGNSNNPTLVETAMTTSTNLLPLSVTATQSCECVNGTQPGCTTNCPDGQLPAKYVSVTASSTVNLIQPTFGITDPFPISVQGKIRTQ
jgi:Flp pilus assembly protein TadG